MKLTPYHAKYFAFELTKRISSNDPEKLAASLLDAQVEITPHQVEAALFAFKSPLSKGALLADEVGLGKTIEAGLVISQKWAERKRKILIIVPANLRKQWNQELIDKFFIQSLILESASFKEESANGNINPFQQDVIVICSYHFARSKDMYIQDIPWDLVVIDEAHHLRNVYKKQNKIANAIKNAVHSAPKILLTATPMQNSLMELYGLVSVIDEHTFGDIDSFKDQYSRLNGALTFNELKERLKPICKRTLRRQVLEYIKYTNRHSITEPFEPCQNEQRLYDLVSEYLQRERLYALPASQRQLMTLMLRKLLASSTFAISGTFKGLAQKLENMLQEQKNEYDFEPNLKENIETFEEIKEEWSEDDTDDSNREEVNPEEMSKIQKEIADLKGFQALAESIQKNSKGEVLLSALKRGFTETEKLGGNKKAIIFTESTRTQKYLEGILDRTEEYRGKIVLFNGTNSDQNSREIYKKWLKKNEGTDRVTGSKNADMRAAIVEYFRYEAVIMIATEAAAEGINLQFCSLVVNYDLPWNPQRIEQRIGRCHRYGQKFDVVVVNFLNKKNAADQRVFQLLDEKFQLFSGVFGASDEIVGHIGTGVDFEKRIAKIYQECRTAEEIQSKFDKLQKDLEGEIDEQMKTTKRQLLENFDEEVHEKLRVSMDNSKKYISKYEKWLWDISEFYLENYARFDTERNSFYLTTNPFPEEKLHTGPYKLGKNIDDANIYRVGHTLAQRIINCCKQTSLEAKELIFDLTNNQTKISILNDLEIKSGWLRVFNFTVESFEAEDHVKMCGIFDNGREMDEEQCRRLFSLKAEVDSTNSPDFVPSIREKLEKIASFHELSIIENNEKRNREFFESEIEKLDKWAEDRKNSLEISLKELDRDIKLQKTEAKKILNLEEKVKKQREIKELEKKRNIQRRELFVSQDEVDESKEKLLNEIESRIRQRLSKEELFTIKWRII
jgi:ERCC4-related helicase